jgi:two-component system cell cycle response regulator DivK
LVVDDEPDNLEVVAETLEFHGVTVKTASNGIDALDVLKGFHPNLILLDLSMPKMNGWETRTNIKADAQTSHIPIVALTAHAMAGDSDRALAAGFDGYMIKPINILTLINDVRAAVVNQPVASPAVPSQPVATGVAEPNQPPSNNQVANKEPLTS